MSDNEYLSYLPDSFLHSTDPSIYNADDLNDEFKTLFYAEFNLAVIDGTIENAGDRSFYEYFLQSYRLPYNSGNPSEVVKQALSDTELEIDRIRSFANSGERIKKFATAKMWGSLLKCKSGEMFLVGSGMKDSPLFSYDPFDPSIRDDGDGVRFMTESRLEQLKLWVVRMKAEVEMVSINPKILVQQGKKKNQFKIFELSNGLNGPQIKPIGFEGLGTSCSALSKFEHRRGNELLFKSCNIAVNGAPIDIVAALNKVFNDVQILYSNNYSCGQMEDITNLPEEYSFSL